MLDVQLNNRTKNQEPVKTFVLTLIRVLATGLNPVRFGLGSTPPGSRTSWRPPKWSLQSQSQARADSSGLWPRLCSYVLKPVSREHARDTGLNDHFRILFTFFSSCSGTRRRLKTQHMLTTFMRLLFKNRFGASTCTWELLSISRARARSRSRASG